MAVKMRGAAEKQQGRLRYWARAVGTCLTDCLFLNVALGFSCLFFTYLLKKDSPIFGIYLRAIPVLTAG
ncbi:MAG: hypothetical protein LBS18_03895, partial [Clostridiales bacterium]|nr:hypothetical protein [Clostridiales bacterium]